MRGLSVSPERRAIFPGHLLPCGLALMRPEIHPPVFIARLQENPPAVFRHSHVVELRPPVRLHAYRRAQVDVIVAAFGGPHVVPPPEKRRLPVLERALQHAVSSQVDVVWNFFRVIDHDFPQFFRNPSVKPSPNRISPARPCHRLSTRRSGQRRSAGQRSSSARPTNAQKSKSPVFPWGQTASSPQDRSVHRGIAPRATPWLGEFHHPSRDHR